MTVKVSSEETNISQRAGATAAVADAENLSTGKVVKTTNSESTTLYVSVDGAVNISIEVSPDGGETWFVLPESPLKLDAPASGEPTNDTAIAFKYDFDRLRITSSDAGVAVSAAIREVV